MIKIDIIKLNINHYIRCICFIMILCVMFIDAIIVRLGKNFEYFPLVIILLIIVLLVFNFVVKRYDVIGELILNENHIFLKDETKEEILDSNNELEIYYCQGNYKGEIAILESLLSGNEIFDGSNNFITIKTKEKIKKVRILIPSKSTQDRLTLYLRKTSGISKASLITMKKWFK